MPLTRLLTPAVVLTYLVMMVGAVVTHVEGQWVAFGTHFRIAGSAGLAIVWSLISVHRSGRRPTVQALLALATLLYPVQAAIGGWLWLAPADGVGTLHLGIAMVLFGLSLVGLIQLLNDDVATNPAAATDATDGTSDPVRTDDRSADRSAPTTVLGTLPRRCQAYLVLTKPWLMWLLCLLAIAGMSLAAIAGAALDGRNVVVLAAIVMVWTPVHFYNLAIVHADEYAAAGYPMLPVVKGIDVTRRRIGYTLGLTATATALLAAVATWTSVSPLVPPAPTAHFTPRMPIWGCSS